MCDIDDMRALINENDTLTLLVDCAEDVCDELAKLEACVQLSPLMADVYREAKTMRQTVQLCGRFPKELAGGSGNP